MGKLVKIVGWSAASIIGISVAVNAAGGGDTDTGKTHAEEVVAGLEKTADDAAKSPAEEKKDVPKVKKKPAPDYTAGQENAIASASEYLDYGSFSQKGLVEQLSSEYGDGFSKADATFAVAHIKVDWNKQAVASAKEYLDNGSFSKQGLIEQLESSYGEQFTHAQAVYGVSKTGL